jgi:hypothetical protein
MGPELGYIRYYNLKTIVLNHVNDALGHLCRRRIYGDVNPNLIVSTTLPEIVAHALQ